MKGSNGSVALMSHKKKLVRLWGRDALGKLLSCRAPGVPTGIISSRSRDKKTGIIIGRGVRWRQREQKKGRCTTRGSQKGIDVSLQGGSAEKDCGGQTEGRLGVSGWWIESTIDSLLHLDRAPTNDSQDFR